MLIQQTSPSGKVIKYEVPEDSLIAKALGSWTQSGGVEYIDVKTAKYDKPFRYERGVDTGRVITGRDEPHGLNG